MAEGPINEEAKLETIEIKQKDPDPMDCFLSKNDMIRVGSGLFSSDIDSSP